MKTIQIAFVGSVGSGKTSLVKRCLNLGFEENSTKPTLGMQFHSTDITIGSENYKCNFIDTQGFDNNRGITMIPQYKRFHGFIVVYDVTELCSFENSKQCYEQIIQNCQLENQNIAFIANKNDLDKNRKVSYQQASQYCFQRQINYVQTSALKNDYIKKIIELIAKNLICSGKIKLDNNNKTKTTTKTTTTNKPMILNTSQVRQAQRKGCFRKFLQALIAIRKIFT